MQAGSKKLWVGAGLGSLFFAWLFRSWWFWIIVLEVAAAVVLLITLGIVGGVMGMWIEDVKRRQGGRIRETRTALRKHRDAQRSEIAELKRKLQATEGSGRNGRAGR